MGKRKPIDGSITIDLDSPASEDFENQPPKQCARRRRIARKQDEETECSTVISSCSVETIPCDQKSKKRSKGRNDVSGTKKKLDTRAFDIHFKNMWRNFSEDKRTPFTYFDSLWFSAYMSSSSKECMLTWIKEKHIFSKRYVLVPIVYWRHWSLLIFCNLGQSLQSENSPPCMLLLDSLQMAGPRRLEPAIRKFVFDIYKSEGRPESRQSISQIPLLVPKVPQQRNDEECGNYVLYFISLFVQQAPENFSMKNYPSFMTDKWFNLEGLEKFCEKLKTP
ncbi:probable ubiquitin-like-specific protease 2A isoform X1 [Manihot esculenta]|uniref:Ubiquitin-like protease family profile domain-containing protein n=1 Tax=Manihot esculenta TaxID=3983 RepID=A0A2C9UMR9_MANES|nr:probable ubiquitin-like-specific protease 2A isoform X1 [Manihot esculenta]OAY32221.1 hypothetical protein MANES_13G001050v8 [Manihot esculenta]